MIIDFHLLSSTYNILNPTIYESNNKIPIPLKINPNGYCYKFTPILAGYFINSVQSFMTSCVEPYESNFCFSLR